ncbi:hypothetical protein SELMODRAFT_112604 [Selaginella moellendorffii]|uniref:Uncharacterized protein n=1 Tax=Selaginella moellendorffii TaxID=88036 RepID=D8SAQ8_SELML|nr:flavin mononucleotide hydrolase 1, chloroplatic isoform X1 [Selaginella moellendorffii]EFJ18467.1 hypothetical protein SELMODRAFT_112604 [Selaginella moellendorffii]|eukprot:XP_002980207.1 flavin mononucleotide hydrolase 1, chloroplatic isoform X1 [Selaginella moellendorffii]
MLRSPALDAIGCGGRLAPVARTRPMSSSSTLSMGGNLARNNIVRKLPVLLFDVMGTIVRDPFYKDVPAFFGLSMKELLEIKHPTAWIEFEKGLITEEQLKHRFFNDGRDFDLQGLKSCMVAGYEFIEGMEELLCSLKSSGFEMHAFTNYPDWYMLIEDKLQLSRYLEWTFVSCHTGKRKPEINAYLDVLQKLQVDSSDCTFVDDQRRNVEAAKSLGINAIIFESFENLCDKLAHLKSL